MSSSESNPDIEPDFSRLVTKYLENQISVAEVAELNAALRSDEGKRDIFLWLCITHSAVATEITEQAENRMQELEETDGNSASEAVDLNDVTILPAIQGDFEMDEVEVLPGPISLPPVPIPLNPSRKWRKAGVILVPLLTAGLLWLWIAHRQPVCQVTAELDATWDRADDMSMNVGSTVPDGLHTLNTGILKLRLASHFDVVIQAPARFEILSESRIKLSSGKLCTRAAPGGSGLIVITPDLQATDLGTEFAVAVVDQKSTHVEVFEGRVRASVDSGSGATPVSQTVTAQQAVRVLTNSRQIDPDVPTPVVFIRPSEIDALVAGHKLGAPPVDKPEIPNLSVLDVGSPQLAGQSSYDGSAWKIFSAGQDTWNEADQCTFFCGPAAGDMTVVTQVVQISRLFDGSPPYCGKAGIMLRESNDPKSPFVNLVMANDRGLQLIYRDKSAATAKAACTITGLAAPIWLKLARTGNVFTANYSIDGKVWKQISTCTTVLPDTVQTGLIVTSGTKGVLATAMFSNLSLTNAAPKTK